MEQLVNENPCPADEDVQILRAVVDRILVEFEVENTVVSWLKMT